MPPRVRGITHLPVGTTLLHCLAGWGERIPLVVVERYGWGDQGALDEAVRQGVLYLDDDALGFTDAATRERLATELDAAGALELVTDAAEFASSRLDHAGAAGSLRRALALLPRVPGSAARRGPLLLALARALFRAGQVDEAWSSCEEAAWLGRDTDDALLVADAAVVVRGGGPGFRPFTAQQNALCRQALSLLGATDPVRAHRLRAQLASTTNPWSIHVPGGDVPVGLAAEDAESALLSLQARHAALLAVEHVHDRLALSDEAMAVGTEECLAWGLLWRLDALYQLGRRVELDNELLSLTAVVGRLREPLWEYRLLNIRSSLAVLDDQLATADHLSQRAFALGQSCGLADALFGRAITTSHLALVTGQGLADAEAQVRELLVGAPFFARGWHAQLLVALGRTDEAAADWRAISGQLNAVPRATPEWLIAHAGHVDLALAFQDGPAAAQLYELLLPFEELVSVGGAQTPPSGPVALQLARLAALTGERSAERKHLRTAVRVSEAVHDPRSAQVARDRLAALTRDRPELTARELEVVQRIAEGASNRGIAAQLVLSERTVERHVSNVMRKLNLPNRAGVAAWYAADIAGRLR